MSDLKIYAQNLESAAMEQIETLASAPAFDGARIRIMPGTRKLRSPLSPSAKNAGGRSKRRYAEAPRRRRATA